LTSAARSRKLSKAHAPYLSSPWESYLQSWEIIRRKAGKPKLMISHVYCTQRVSCGQHAPCRHHLPRTICLARFFTSQHLCFELDAKLDSALALR
jgi:hypothetical protein